MKKLLSCFFSFVLMFGLVGSFCRAEEAVPQEVVIEDASSKLESEEVKGASIWEITLNYIKDVLFNVRDFGLKSYPVFKSWLNSTYCGTKDWTSEKYDELKVWSAENYPVFKSWINSTYYDAKDWTSEKFGALKALFYNSTKEEL
ncbi:unknown [Clostridium sp. CAG:557]|nr:unknown [Clostridium sp. CAG:557]